MSRITGIRVERKLFRLPRGTLVGPAVCRDNPDDCCSGSDYYDLYDQFDVVRDVPGRCPALTSYLLPRRLYLSIQTHPECLTGGGCPGGPGQVGCPNLFTSSIPCDYDESYFGGPAWRGDVFGTGGEEHCHIQIQLWNFNVGADPSDCFGLSGILTQWQGGIQYDELINDGGTFTLSPAVAFTLDPFYLEFRTINDCGACAGVYVFTE